MQFAEAIKAVKEKIDFLALARRYMTLKQNGSRFMGPCPFHQETKPSFSIDPDKGFFHCFGCQASGDVFEFYSRINGLSFRETLEELAAECGITIASGGAEAKNPEKKSDKRTMYALHALASNIFRSALVKPEGRKCREYIQKRGLSPEITERFELGWADNQWRVLSDGLNRLGYNPELAHECGLLGRSENGKYYDRFRGRLIFPIKNLTGQIVAFGGRILEGDEAKYINSSDTPIYHKKDHLYGLAQARRAITSKGWVLLTEGYMDVLTLHQFGYENSVGVLGTALTEEQIKRLSGFASRLVLVFDGDGAGRKAALRSAALLLARGLSCKVVLLPEGEDIDSLLRNGGTKIFDSLLESAMDGLNYCLECKRNEAPKEALEWAREFLGSIQLPELVSNFTSLLSLRLRIDESLLRHNLVNSAVRGVPKNQAAPDWRLMRDREILVFAVRYPERLDDLRKLGADLALTSQRAKKFWRIIESCKPDEIPYSLDEKQKQFWFSQRGPSAPPLTSGDEELESLRKCLNNFYLASHKSSLSAALAERANSGDFAADLEFLRALKETMEKNRAQS